MRRIVIVFIIFALGTGYVKAGTTIFSDNFNTENNSSGMLNYNNFTNWTVSDGTVDLIGNGFWDFLPGNGLYVDMDGSTGNAGILTTKSGLLNLNAGTYVLSFDLAGNQNNSSYEQVNVLVTAGPLFSNSYSLPQTAPFTTFKGIFNVVTPGNYFLSFEGIGGDNIGMLLDNVSVSLIPAPGAILLGSIGAGFVGWLRKRRTL